MHKIEFWEKTIDIISTASVQQAVVTEFNIGEWFVQDCPALHLLLKKLGGTTVK